MITEMVITITYTDIESNTSVKLPEVGFHITTTLTTISRYPLPVSALQPSVNPNNDKIYNIEVPVACISIATVC